MKAEKLTVVNLIKEPDQEMVPPHVFGRVRKKIDFSLISEKKNIIVLIEPFLLQTASLFLKRANQSHLLKGLLVRETPKYFSWIPQMFLRADLHVLKHVLVETDTKVFRRILKAWSVGGQDSLIANARVLENHLLIQNCALESVEVPIKEIPALKTIDRAALENFSISESGSNIHWPEGDIHLDFESFKYYTDADYRKSVETKNLIQNKKFGEAIARLRQQHNLKQSDIPELSERQIRRFEREGDHPSTQALKLLARAHGMTFSEYLNKIGAEIDDITAPMFC